MFEFKLIGQMVRIRKKKGKKIFKDLKIKIKDFKKKLKTLMTNPEPKRGKDVRPRERMRSTFFILCPP